MANSAKGFLQIGVGIIMTAFGAAGLNSAHAAELTADELRQVTGGISPLQALSHVVGPLAQAGGNATRKAAKVGATAAAGGGVGLAQYLAANRDSPNARAAALAFGTGAAAATMPPALGIFVLR